MICKNTDCFRNMLDENKPSCKKGCLNARHSGQKIACTDSGKTYYLENPDHLTAAVVKIDGCVIENDKGREYEKCDFALLVGDSKRKPIAVLVELKGIKTNHAITQIQETLTALKDTLRKFDKVYARILGTQVPKREDNHKYRDLEKELRKCNGNLAYRPWRKGNDSPNDTVTVTGNDIRLQ